MPESMPFSVSLLLPETGSVVLRTKEAAGETVSARIEDDREGKGLTVEVADKSGRRLWSHDFGYNMSAPEGCQITVHYESGMKLLLVSYGGYKWDHDHRLVLIDESRQNQPVREYSSADADILPALKKEKDFPAGYNYWIYPLSVEKGRLTFECIPIEKPELERVHPFAQDQPWYVVTGTINDQGRFVPAIVKSDGKGR